MRYAAIALGLLAALLMLDRYGRAVPVNGTRGSVTVQSPAAPRVDIHGNQVTPALADYRVDLRGTMYERHAPHTALPELGEPEA